MIIYIYQGMMALGKGGIHHGGAEKGNAGRGGWGKEVPEATFILFSMGTPRSSQRMR